MYSTQQYYREVSRVRFGASCGSYAEQQEEQEEEEEMMGRRLCGFTFYI